jgi:hypothetical protein
MRDKTTRGPRGGSESLPHADGSDVYEMFVAELQGRRERLSQLLRMLTVEADRHAPSRTTLARHVRCQRPATRIS